jgi:hypothetical protein
VRSSQAWLVYCGLGEEVSMRMYYESEMGMFEGLQNVYVENTTPPMQ